MAGDDEDNDEAVEMPSEVTPAEMPLEGKQTEAMHKDKGMKKEAMHKKEKMKEYKLSKSAPNTDQADLKKSPTAAGTRIPAAIVSAFSHGSACLFPSLNALTIGAQPSA